MMDVCEYIERCGVDFWVGESRHETPEPPDKTIQTSWHEALPESRKQSNLEIGRWKYTLEIMRERKKPKPKVISIKMTHAELMKYF